MSHGAGTTWSAQLFAQSDIKATGTVSYYVVATDASPARMTGRTPPADTTFVVRKCDIPPTMTDYAINSPSSNVPTIYVQRKGTSGPELECAVYNDKTNYIRVTGFATDPDDTVVKMVFRYKPYGRTTYKTLTLAPGGSSGGLFTGTLYRKDFTTLPSKKSASYQFDGYFVATDRAGRSTTRYPPQPFTLSLYEKSCSP